MALRSDSHQRGLSDLPGDNDGVFDTYTPEIMNCRRSGIITGLPDAYGRGRIIGDYRRVALYGTDRLLEVKREERHTLTAVAAVTRTDQTQMVRRTVPCRPERQLRISFFLRT